jgi:N-formylglutamate deformylase
LQQRLERILAAQRAHTHVVNGRFKGGYITRHYGRPAETVDAIQLELAQRNYMDEDSFEYREELAEPRQRVLRGLLEACLE